MIQETMTFKKQQNRQFKLLKDIVIPAGTVFSTAPAKTERFGNDHVSRVIGLSQNTAGEVNYCIDEPAELAEWFEEVLP